MTLEEVKREKGGRRVGSVPTPCWLVREALDWGQDTHNHTHTQAIHTPLVYECAHTYTHTHLHSHHMHV